MAIPQLIAAGTKALGTFFGGQDSAAPVLSGGGTYAPGGINVGSKVVGSGSASTSQPANPILGAASFSGSGSAVSGVPPWLPWAAAAVVILLAVSLLRRK